MTTPEPYLRIGRGGAGNYLTHPQPLQEPSTNHSSLSSPTDDLESQTSPSTTQPVSAQDQGQAQAQAQAEYAHSGRGGAGNWYSPRELSATGSYDAPGLPTSTSGSSAAADEATPARAPATSAASPSASVAEPAYYGRGGAGNFNARSFPVGGGDGEGKGSVEQGKEEKERERERRRERIGEMVRRNVEMGLRRPEGAYLRRGGGRMVEVGDE